MLQSTERFKNDHKRYLAKIQQIPEGAFKQEVKELLNKLISEVRKLDSMHMEMIYTKQMPSMGSDIKQDILTLRKKLDSKLKSLD